MISSIIKEFAINALAEELKPYVNDVKDALANAARDNYERVITGRRTIDEWAGIAIKGVDKVKDKVAEQNGWKYVGGKLNFAMSKKNSDKVVISFELYYQDNESQWQKLGAESDMYASNFTLDALEDIKKNGSVSFEVE